MPLFSRTYGQQNMERSPQEAKKIGSLQSANNKKSDGRHVLAAFYPYVLRNNGYP
jgi:hypothetical protein